VFAEGLIGYLEAVSQAQCDSTCPCSRYGFSPQHILHDP